MEISSIDVQKTLKAYSYVAMDNYGHKTAVSKYKITSSRSSIFLMRKRHLEFLV